MFIPLIITLVAGLSTILGSTIIFIKRKNLLYYSLAFASGVMLTVSVTDLIPESFNYLTNYFNNFISILLICISFNIGVIISFLIDKYLPDNTDEVYRVGVVSWIAIIMHNIPEGIATFIAGVTDIKLGITLAVAIALHNIPEGITIALPIHYSTKSKFKAIFYTTVAGLSEFLGAIVALLFLKNLTNYIFIGLLLSVIAGIMFQISMYELFPQAIKLKSKKIIFYFIVGGVIMFLSSILI